MLTSLAVRASVASLAACRRLRVEMDEAPSGRSSPTSTGRSSPTNDASDDPAAAISRIASLFQSLNRLRDAGYGTSVIAAKVAECRAAVVSLPPDLQAKVVALRSHFPPIHVRYVATLEGLRTRLALPEPVNAYLHADDVRRPGV